jgi:RNA polymerase sigma-70 factor, ECF subfamily
LAEGRKPGEWEALMAAGLTGDAAAYRSLLSGITPFIRSAVRRTFTRGGLGAVDIEDIVQDVLLAIHLKRHTWDAALPLAPWLNAVARHKTIDALRRHGGRTTTPIDELADVLPDERSANPGHGDAERILGVLPDKQRRIVQAMTLEERSAADIGRELGMTEGAVRVALHRSLKLLAEKFRTALS